MNNKIYRLLSTQFLTAFADNAVLFTAITMVLKEAEKGNWYIPALQASFLIAFVFLAPWVGRFADSWPKPKILFIANVIKAIGAGLLFLHIEPLIAYAVIGIGAATYSPAKYGILPELVNEKKLVKANGWIEGSTILAILGGTVVGAFLSEYSVAVALGVVMTLYILSAVIALTIKHTQIIGIKKGNALPIFKTQMSVLFATPSARFATLGVSLFWASATVLRLLLIVWVPAVLLINSTTDIALLTMFVAIGIAVGSLLVPKLIPLAYLRRARLAAYLMGMAIIILAVMDNILLIKIMLFLIGVCGGLFVVPINATLQEIGHKTIGSGGAVAIQNFFENLAMLLASSIYAIAADIDPVTTMIWLGILVVLATLAVSWRLPKDTGSRQSITTHLNR